MPTWHRCWVGRWHTHACWAGQSSACAKTYRKLWLHTRMGCPRRPVWQGVHAHAWLPLAVATSACASASVSCSIPDTQLRHAAITTLTRSPPACLVQTGSAHLRCRTCVDHCNALSATVPSSCSQLLKSRLQLGQVAHMYVRVSAIIVPPTPAAKAMASQDTQAEQKLMQLKPQNNRITCRRWLKEQQRASCMRPDGPVTRAAGRVWRPDHGTGARAGASGEAEIPHRLLCALPLPARGAFCLPLCKLCVATRAFRTMPWYAE